MPSIKQLMFEGLSGDDLAAELVARGTAISIEEARFQIMIAVTADHADARS